MLHGKKSNVLTIHPSVRSTNVLTGRNGLVRNSATEGGGRGKKRWKGELGWGRRVEGIGRQLRRGDGGISTLADTMSGDATRAWDSPPVYESSRRAGRSRADQDIVVPKSRKNWSRRAGQVRRSRTATCCPNTPDPISAHYFHLLSPGAAHANRRNAYCVHTAGQLTSAAPRGIVQCSGMGMGMTKGAGGRMATGISDGYLCVRRAPGNAVNGDIPIKYGVPGNSRWSS